MKKLLVVIIIVIAVLFAGDVKADDIFEATIEEVNGDMSLPGNIGIGTSSPDNKLEISGGGLTIATSEFLNDTGLTDCCAGPGTNWRTASVVCTDGTGHITCNDSGATVGLILQLAEEFLQPILPNTRYLLTFDIQADTTGATPTITLTDTDGLVDTVTTLLDGSTIIPTSSVTHFYVFTTGATPVDFRMAITQADAGDDFNIDNITLINLPTAIGTSIYGSSESGVKYTIGVDVENSRLMTGTWSNNHLRYNHTIDQFVPNGGNAFWGMDTDASGWGMRSIGSLGTGGVSGSFDIKDSDSSTVPFVIEKATPDNSLYINAGGLIRSDTMHYPSGLISTWGLNFENSTGTLTGTELTTTDTWSSNSGAINLTTDTAANIIAAMGGTCVTNQTFIHRIFNAGTGIITILKGSGITTGFGDNTIAIGFLAEFAFRITSCVVSSEAATIYTINMVDTQSDVQY